MTAQADELASRIVLDGDGYPTDDALDAIANWPKGDWPAMMRAIKAVWRFAESGWSEDDTADYECAVLYSMATGGWSGNESIIDAMWCNEPFWSTCWGASVRGGRYSFQVAK